MSADIQQWAKPCLTPHFGCVLRAAFAYTDFRSIFVVWAYCAPRQEAFMSTNDQRYFVTYGGERSDVPGLCSIWKAAGGPFTYAQAHEHAYQLMKAGPQGEFDSPNGFFVVDSEAVHLARLNPPPQVLQCPIAHDPDDEIPF